MSTILLTPQDIKDLERSEFAPLVFLFKKFGQVFDNGEIKVNLSRPCMPDPGVTKWNLLPFNEGDCLIDLVWDLFLKHGQSYGQAPIFDTLRNHLGVVAFTESEALLIKDALSFYKSDSSQWDNNNEEIYQNIVTKLRIG